MAASRRKERPAEVTVLFQGKKEPRGPSILIDMRGNARKPKPTALSRSGTRRLRLREDLPFGAPLDLINSCLDELDGILQSTAQLDDPVGRLASTLRTALSWLVPRVSSFLQDVAEFKDALILTLQLLAVALLPLPDLEDGTGSMDSTLESTASGSASTSNFPDQLTMSDVLEDDDDLEDAGAEERERDFGDRQDGSRHRGTAPVRNGPDRQMPTDSADDEYASAESFLRRPARYYPPPARCKRDLEFHNGD